MMNTDFISIEENEHHKFLQDLSSVLAALKMTTYAACFALNSC
jgi:hypothetical protein